jgi:alpha-amylase
MPAVTLYFQVHQPFRIKPYSYFDIGSGESYFDDALNSLIMQRVAERCYLPANKILLDLINRFEGGFKVAFSLSGVAIEQMKLYAPRALESFRALASTGCVEFLGETYQHSLASLYHVPEFVEQVQLHRAVLAAEFGVESCVFRNTELIYGDNLAGVIGSLGYRAVLAEGVGQVLGWRSAHHTYHSPDGSLTIIPRDFRLSDDVAFRYSSQGQDNQTLSAEVFAGRLHDVADGAEVFGLFMDYETFGEHISRESGILDFLAQLPAAVMQRSEWSFATPSDVATRLQSAGELSFPEVTSWADSERDLSAWSGNEMQRSALTELYSLADRARAAGGEVLETWRRLQASDNFHYMSTKSNADGEVHSLFRHFDSPYKAFIAFRNVLTDLAQRLQ